MSNAEINLKTRRPPAKHAEVLSILHFAYGGLHAFAIALALTMLLGSVLATSGRSWENDIVREGIVLFSVLFPIVVAIPIAAGYGLMKKRNWARIAVGFSATASFLIAIVLALMAIGEREDYGTLIYILPCMLMSSYSVWFLWRKPAG